MRSPSKLSSFEASLRLPPLSLSSRRVFLRGCFLRGASFEAFVFEAASFEADSFEVISFEAASFDAFSFRSCLLRGFCSKLPFSSSFLRGCFGAVSFEVASLRLPSSSLPPSNQDEIKIEIVVLILNPNECLYCFHKKL